MRSPEVERHASTFDKAIHKPRMWEMKGLS